MPRLRLVPAVAAVVLSPALGALAACTGQDGPAPDATAEDLAAALTAGRPAGVPFTGETDPRRLWREVTAGMDEATPSVTLSEVSDPTEAADGGQRATATLSYEWALPGTEETWTHEGTAALTRPEEGTWSVVAAPALLDLEQGETLDLTEVEPRRGGITGAGGAVIVRDRPVVRFGVDKAQVGPAGQARAARAVARAVDVDASDLLAAVRAAGDEAFVEAIVLREAEATRALLALDGVAGAGTLSDTLPLAPTRDFARPLLGTVGPVTAELIEASKGAFEVGDEAGISGLQQRYDERLRGTPGWVVTAEGEEDSRRLFRVAPVAGGSLATTLDVDLQSAAERILLDVRPASALVALRPSTGEVLAAASGPGSEGYSTATFGQYAPGSTFKIVSSLALVRGGLGASSPVPCPTSVVVDGKTFENYDDYPADGTGTIPLREAVANSCNTAFIAQRNRVDDLPGAAAALGLGVDHDLGFPAYFGQVPPPGSETTAAADLIGQGEVLASPLVMAAVMASVVEGATVVPHLLGDVTPTADVEQPLTGDEAATLRALLRGVVTDGSGEGLADLPGPPVLAKTGTAEFGDGEPLRTHAWMVAAQGDLAVAAFVEQGESGSGTAGPLLERLLRSASSGDGSTLSP